jgi:phage gp46-like protein
MAADALLNNDAKYWDIGFANGDLILTYGFETAILMSLFLDKRASETEVAKVELRRGWWGNDFSDYDNYEIGSKLWFLDQARADINTLNLAQTYANDGLSWFLTDNYCTKITVDTSYTIGNLIIDVTLYRPNNLIINNSYTLWDNTHALSFT